MKENHRMHFPMHHFLEMAQAEDGMCLLVTWA